MGQDFLKKLEGRNFLRGHCDYITSFYQYVNIIYKQNIQNNVSCNYNYII